MKGGHYTDTMQIKFAFAISPLPAGSKKKKDVESEKKKEREKKKDEEWSVGFKHGTYVNVTWVLKPVYTSILQVKIHFQLKRTI